MIRHIVAIDSQRGIAKNGVQPWKIPEDEQYFQAQTKTHGGVVLMGRKTFAIIRHALAERENFVLSRDANLQLVGATVVADLQSFLETHDDVWIIGGAEIFAQTLAAADELYITKIEADLGCDQFYPEYADTFELVSQSPVASQNGYKYAFCVYKRLK